MELMRVRPLHQGGEMRWPEMEKMSFSWESGAGNFTLALYQNRTYMS
jgi:hypothetical protein